MNNQPSLAVIQTAPEIRDDWMRRCLESVKAWAARFEFAYHFVEDSVRDKAPKWVWEKTIESPQSGFDLLRLLWMEELLESQRGHDYCLWIDADTLILDPKAFFDCLPWNSAFAVGRENWLDCEDDKPPRIRRHVHNAVLWAQAGNPVLPFYRFAAERILRRIEPPFVPQLIGPKLLSSWHNVIQFDVIEQCTMMSPDLASALLAGNRGVVDTYLSACETSPATLNLCSSLLSEQTGHALVRHLCQHGLACQEL